MCPPDYPFRQAVPDGLTKEYCQAEKIILMGRKDSSDGLTKEYCQAEKILLLG